MNAPRKVFLSLPWFEFKPPVPPAGPSPLVDPPNPNDGLKAINERIYAWHTYEMQAYEYCLVGQVRSIVGAFAAFLVFAWGGTPNAGGICTSLGTFFMFRWYGRSQEQRMKFHQDNCDGLVSLSRAFNRAPTATNSP